MKLNKKIMLGLGAMTAVAVPIIAVVSCSNGQSPIDKLHKMGRVLTKESALANGYVYTTGELHTLKGERGDGAYATGFDDMSIEYIEYYKDDTLKGEHVFVLNGSGSVSVDQSVIHSGKTTIVVATPHEGR